MEGSVIYQPFPSLPPLSFHTSSAFIIDYTMKPPSDALRHSLQKLAEARANRTTTTLPPPPYTLSVSRPTGTSVMTVDQLDPGDSYYPEESTPIIIQIDNSVNVTGNGNTIMLPASGPHTPANESRSSPQMGPLAGVIIGALSRASALRDDSGAARPINITVNSGIRVHGENNVVSRRTTKPEAESTNTRGSEKIAQKRRASSEPIPPEAQRRRLA
ncbi:unnamed protein product [Penicillium olsonii]|nr:unnamed protein product [Penicillium olsonii]